MRIAQGLDVDEGRLAELCRRHRIVELAVFGSALREDFRPGSDIDVLYVFDPDARVGWRGIHDLERDLAELFGRAVDLVPKLWLNPSLADAVLANARTLYAA